jgi:hypothetical protein
MTREQRNAIVVVWSKVSLSKIIIDTIDPEWCKILEANLNAAQMLLEQLIEENSRQEKFNGGDGI